MRIADDESPFMANACIAEEAVNRFRESVLASSVPLSSCYDNVGGII
jgi:hypothetical protein